MPLLLKPAKATAGVLYLFQEGSNVETTPGATARRQSIAKNRLHLGAGYLRVRPDIVNL